ncbi:hypothetical protein [Parvularcula dongshanensis]|uniref:PRC-barrel domain-containing protein n=1 Tax=Parvularcula dongshanensis TaxID=1173995 RepID=A0A840I3S3_9PROT|nr:hypothetical protein [Parvularcula dongshanensis]MBB4658828.1 hypothetical protein [Parvularcula dongshanensis]
MKTQLLSAAALFALAACGGQVTDGGTGSDTDFDAIEAQNATEARPEAEQIASADDIGQPAQEGPGQVQPGELRAEDYPETGEEMTRNPIEPGNEEPGGKDMMLASEYEAMGLDAPQGQRADLEAAREQATGPIVSYDGRSYLAYSGVNASGLIGEDAYGQDGEAEGEIDDLVLSEDGRFDRLVIGGDAYGADAVSFTTDPARDPRLRAEVTGEPSEFDEDALSQNAILVSELLEQPIALGDEPDAIAVADVIMGENGTAQNIAVEYNGDSRIVPFGAVKVAEGDGGRYLDMSAEDLQALEPYVGEPAYEAQ